MKILVACEESQRVCKAFRAKQRRYVPGLRIEVCKRHHQQVNNRLPPGFKGKGKENGKLYRRTARGL